MAICTDVTVFSRYPQDSNIIDFIQVKMLRLIDEFGAAGKTDMAEACWNALDNYMSGSVNIYFQDGQPYIARVNLDDVPEAD